MGKELQKTGVPLPVRTIVGAGLLLTALAFVLPLSTGLLLCVFTASLCRVLFF